MRNTNMVNCSYINLWGIKRLNPPKENLKKGEWNLTNIKQRSLDDKSLYRLIESHPEVDYYDLGIEEIQAVIKAFAKVVLDSTEVDVKIPFPDLGEFYVCKCTYVGGTINNLTGEPLVTPPKDYKVLKFKVKKTIKDSIKAKGMTNYERDDAE